MLCGFLREHQWYGLSEKRRAISDILEKPVVPQARNHVGFAEEMSLIISKECGVFEVPTGAQ